MNVVSSRVNRLCAFLGVSDDHAQQNTVVAQAASDILGRPVAAAEIAAARLGTGDPAQDLLRAIAIHFDVDPRYLLDADAAEMAILDQKLAILETARTLGIRLGAVQLRGGTLTVDTLQLLIKTIQDARPTAHRAAQDLSHGHR